MSGTVTVTIRPRFEIYKLKSIPYQFHEGISTKRWDDCIMLELVERADSEEAALSQLGRVMSGGMHKTGDQYTILKVYG